MRRFAGLERTLGARTLGERLAAARQRGFVGRSAERSLFEAALDGRTAECAVYLHGRGGVGKSALLAEFAALAVRAGVSCVPVDGRGVDPSPAGLLAALGATPTAVTKPPGDLRSPGVILIDHYELLALDRWVRTELFARLPIGTVLVLAARQAPDPGWRADAGLAELCRIVPLRNLTEAPLSSWGCRSAPTAITSPVASSVSRRGCGRANCRGAPQPCRPLLDRTLTAVRLAG